MATRFFKDIGLAMFQRMPDGDYWMGYADAKPEESINKDKFPAIGVAVIFPYHPAKSVLQVPVSQYKRKKHQWKKGPSARRLADWLLATKEEGLSLSGIAHAHSLRTAATLGMDLIEEIKGAQVVPHYSKYRLRFGKDEVDFAQAVALEYYRFTMEFGLLRAGLKVPADHRNLLLMLDRFPAKKSGVEIPGVRKPLTPGFKFINYARSNSATGLGIQKDNASAGLRTKLGTLDWWRETPNSKRRNGKSHPYFTLADWLVAATVASTHRDAFVASFERERIGVDAADGLEELFQAFKAFDIISMHENVPPHIRAAEKQWEIPEDAREFILAKT